MKIICILATLVIIPFLSGCTVSGTTAKGTTFSFGFTPTVEQLESVKGLAK